MTLTRVFSRNKSQVVPWAVLVVLMAFAIIPLISMFVTALFPQNAPPIGLQWPTDPQWKNFVTAFVSADYLPLLWSSVLIELGVVPISVIFATLAGYGLSLHKIPGERYIVGVFLLGLTLPVEALITPLYYQMTSLGLLGTRWALILPLIALYMPFGVFWMRMNFLGNPKELSEAAEIDGASQWQVFWRVQLPLAVPAWSSLVILFFLWTWNQFILTVVLVKNPLMGTMAGALSAFQGQYSTNIVLLCAGCFLILLPTLVVFIVFQRQFVKALLQGSSR